jgi:hypothetical protein
MPNRGEFRATTDQFLEIVERMRVGEEGKREVPMGSEEFVTLAEQVVADARLAYRWSELQLGMAREAQRRLDRGALEPGVRLIEVEPRPMDRILADWREAQIRLEIATPGSPDAAAAADAMDRLREEYAQADGTLDKAARTMGRGPGFDGRDIED